MISATCTTEKNKPAPTINFPKLMRRYDGLVIIAWGKGDEGNIKGTIVQPSNEYRPVGRYNMRVGYYSEKWLANSFIDLAPKEQIVLTQEYN